jgi:integrase
MPSKKALKRYAGVYFQESTIHKWRGRPDRVYWINFRDSSTKKLYWERCGWASEGWTPEAAQNKRREILERDRAGKYKPKFQRKAERISFGHLMQAHYLPWIDLNKKTSKDDHYIFNKWLKPRFSEKSLPAITPLELERLKQFMKQAGRADATILGVIGVLRHAYNKAKEWGLYSGENPCNSVKLPKLNNARQRFLSRDEAAALLKRLRECDIKLHNIAAFSLYGGMRLGEILVLKWAHINLSNGIISILDSKNHESRSVFITDPIANLLSNMRKGCPEGYLFTNYTGVIFPRFRGHPVKQHF